ncbi:hypothetical protein Hlac_3431 (plasmid) [Halorubrum lacusprofundi ATCC 49239]|jgi:hypothetical protein|uniref:Uncharacterized protein n=1 Tax=Halorubrum lacusprofundi (strain ATCC 49239 / DSM 5036 / JCM 8891 / ACAM 34) TaxID=416348 RepID=B9LWV2_HALLT|nr:hypothetical protein Hlac_3431 [Halorubrum lacusprofundi ATCC 49239]
MTKMPGPEIAVSWIEIATTVRTLDYLIIPNL